MSTLTSELQRLKGEVILLFPTGAGHNEKAARPEMYPVLFTHYIQFNQDLFFFFFFLNHVRSSSLTALGLTFFIYCVLIALML